MNGNFDEIWTGNTIIRNDYDINNQEQEDKIQVRVLTGLVNIILA